MSVKQEYLRTIYTEEDEKGFHFIDVAEEEKKQQIALLKIKRNKWILILAFLMIPAIVFYYILETGEYWMDGYVLLCIFIVGVNLYSCYSEMKRIKRETEQYFEVEILKKLPKESEWSVDAGAGGHAIYFYPVIGRDVTTGYESLCYVTYEQYMDAKLHDVIKILRFAKRKRD